MGKHNVHCERINKYFGDDKKLLVGGYEGIPQNVLFNVVAVMVRSIIYPN